MTCGFYMGLDTLPVHYVPRNENLPLCYVLVWFSEESNRTPDDKTILLFVFVTLSFWDGDFYNVFIR